MNENITDPRFAEQLMDLYITTLVDLAQTQIDLETAQAKARWLTWLVAQLEAIPPLYGPELPSDEEPTR